VRRKEERGERRNAAQTAGTAESDTYKKVKTKEEENEKAHKVLD
jgi:hypothetical protein